MEWIEQLKTHRIELTAGMVTVESSVQVLMPQKIRPVEGLINRKSVEAYNSYVVIVSELGESSTNSKVCLRHLSKIQNYEIHFSCGFLMFVNDSDDYIFETLTNDSHTTHSGRVSLVAKVSDRGWLVTSSSLVPLKTRRVGARCTLNLSRAQTSSRWCGMVDRRGEGVPAQVSSSSLDHGSKSRPSPKALV
ncbi:uncharacterized protein TNCV_3868441 [Trichonephila clavipes]|nr:uncharacterized protein TNCV_3868441 [Trichonephila clavipes]